MTFSPRLIATFPLEAGGEKNTTGSREADDTRFLIVGERGAEDTRRYNKRTVEKGFGGIWIDDKEEFAKFAKAVKNYAFEEDGEGVCYTDNYFYAYYRNIDGEAVPYVQINLNAEQSQDLVNKIQNDLEGTIHQRVEQSFDTVAGIVGREQTKGNSGNDAHTSSLNSTRGSRLANDISRKGTYLDSPSLFVKGKRIDGREKRGVDEQTRFRSAETFAEAERAIADVEYVSEDIVAEDEKDTTKAVKNNPKQIRFPKMVLLVCSLRLLRTK